MISVSLEKSVDRQRTEEDYGSFQSVTDCNYSRFVFECQKRILFGRFFDPKRSGR